MGTRKKNVHAVALGRKGGSVKSAKKAISSRLNGLISGLKRRQQKLLDKAERTA